MTHYSFSQINLHRECPRRYYYQYRSPEKPALPHAIYGQGQSAEDLLLHNIDHDPGLVSEQHPKLATLLENFFPDGSRDPLAIQYLAYEVQCRTDYHYVDSTSGFLIDFKLAQLPADDLQLRIYALALHKAYGVTSVRAWYYVIERGFYASYFYDSTDFEATEKELLAYCDAIQEKGSSIEHYPTRVSLKCETCPFVDQCEASEKYRLEMPKSREEAELAYGQMKRAEAKADRLKELLVAFMEHECISEFKPRSGGRLAFQLAKPSLKEYKK